MHTWPGKRFPALLLLAQPGDEGINRHRPREGRILHSLAEVVEMCKLDVLPILWYRRWGVAAEGEVVAPVRGVAFVQTLVVYSQWM